MKKILIFLFIFFFTVTLRVGQSQNASPDRVSDSVLSVKEKKTTNEKLILADSNIAILDQRITVIEQKIESQGQQRSWLGRLISKINIISILISLVFSIILIIIAFKLYLSDNFVHDSVKNYIKHRIAESKKDTGSVSISNKSDHTNLQNELEKLKIEVIEIHKSLTSQRNVVEWVIPHEDKLAPEIVIAEQKIVPVILYLSTPNADGSFNESSAQNSYREGASIYKFTLLSIDRANFEIDVRESSIRLALQYPDKNIDPVCNALNSFTVNTKSIRTDKPGTAVKDGDKWIVTNASKAIIKYE